jgi:ATP-dependent DNA helicase RecG
MSTAKILQYPEDRIFSEQAIRGVLTQLCSQPTGTVESEQLEIKNWCKDEKQLAHKIAEEVACLANASGGILIFGVEPDEKKPTKFSACPYRDVNVSWIQQRIRELTLPPVDATARDITGILRDVTGDSGANAFAVLVPKSKRLSGHITAGGLSKIRIGKECKPYYSVEEDFTKAVDPSATVSNLSLESIQWGIERHQSKFKVPAGTFAGHTDFLLQTGLIERYTPHDQCDPSYRLPLAAILLFGKQSALGILAFETIVSTEHQNSRFRKNIVETYKELCGSAHALLPNLCPRIPLRTIQELFMNACIHRSYRTNGPIIVRVSASAIEVESPGELPLGVHTDNLIHCVPVYRNFLLAEGARHLGLCDKIGQGIDLVYTMVLENGFGFPSFESRDNRVTARVPMGDCPEFREFVKKRAQALNQLDELMVLRLLWDKQQASSRELYSLMQRGSMFGEEVLDRMFKKTMIEPMDGTRAVWCLSEVLRRDIRTIFQADQMSFGIDLFGDGSLYGR